jgi:hypothetical protein
MTQRPELLDATDEIIYDAVKYADPMVLRGLLYQLTGDQSLQATEVTSIQFGFLEAQVLASPAAVAISRQPSIRHSEDVAVAPQNGPCPYCICGRPLVRPRPTAPSCHSSATISWRVDCAVRRQKPVSSSTP